MNINIKLLGIGDWAQFLNPKSPFYNIRIIIIQFYFIKQEQIIVVHIKKEKALESGLVKNIGLSNFESDDLDEILKIFKVKC